MIYIHIPFCRSFCTYCDFYSEVAAKCRKAEDRERQEALFEAYGKAAGCEIRHRADEITSDVNTLYIGGGTPSVLPLSVYSSIMEDLAFAGAKPPFDEFTFEVNPEDIVAKGAEYVRGLMELGVNRFSMGVQSFDDGILRWMNRRHDAATAREAYRILRESGVKNISIDLIFGLPQLSDEQWSQTLEQALEIAPDGIPPKHISAYQLSVEPSSALAKLVARGVWSEASDELCERQYAILCETLARAGYHHYEISNFAQPGYEAVHNSAYWRHVPYVGIGPGAHSFCGGTRRCWNGQDLEAYIEDPLAVCDGEILDEGQLAMERIMLALRTSEGLEASFLEACCDMPALARALDEGDIVRLENGNIRIPESRFFVSDAIISEII